MRNRVYCLEVQLSKRKWQWTIHPGVQVDHTATKIPFIYSQMRGFSPNFHIHVSVSDLYMYIPRIGPLILLQQKRQTDLGNRSETHECGSWDWGRTIPFLGIFVSNFWYCVFAVQESRRCVSSSIDLHTENPGLSQCKRGRIKTERNTVYNYAFPFPLAVFVRCVGQSITHDYRLQEQL